MIDMSEYIRIIKYHEENKITGKMQMLASNFSYCFKYMYDNKRV
jgi:hypothetical protein